MAQFLYLVRHGEQLDAEHGVVDGPLSPRGLRQAQAVAERLSGVPFDRAWHSPLQRAAETAAIMGERMPGVPFEPSALLMDCVPSGPTADTPAGFMPYFGSVTDEQIEAGTAQMADAIAEWLTPSAGDRHELLVTHNAVIAWFVREVFAAPSWRWLGVHQANCGLTILRVRTAKPPVLLTHNDLGHLLPELRTGLAVDQLY